MFIFGTGNVFITPSNLPGMGIQIGTLQNIEIDFDQTIASLYGQNKFPDAIAQGEAKITGKAKSGKFSLQLASTMLLNETISTGQTQCVVDESGTVPAPSGPYTITVTNSATWTKDLGVRDAATGTPLTRVASGPTTGQYSVAAGVYTFAAADTGDTMKISYLWTTTGGQTMNGNQQLMGSQTAFSIVLKEKDPTTGEQMVLTLYQAVGSKLSLPMVNNNFSVSDIEFECFANSSGQVYQWSTQQAAIST